MFEVMGGPRLIDWASGVKEKLGGFFSYFEEFILSSRWNEEFICSKAKIVLWYFMNEVMGGQRLVPIDWASKVKDN